MTKDLRQAKTQLRRKYLGKEGIHAFGIRRKDNAVCVYTTQPELSFIEQLKGEAAPFNVLVIGNDERAVIHGRRSQTVGAKATEIEKDAIRTDASAKQ